MIPDATKGNVSAENIQVYTKTATYTGKPDTDIAGKTWTVANFNNNNNSWADMIKCGNKTAASTGSVASDFAFNERVSQVVVSFNFFIEVFFNCYYFFD